jgi:hypothetical protein
VRNLFLKKRYSCCACRNTSTTNIHTTFTRVPIITTYQVPSKNADEEDRKIYYQHLFHRKEFLRRLNLLENDKRNDLRICGGHNLELTLIKYPWIDVKNMQQYDMAYLRLPMNPDDPPIRTREQHTLRKPLPPRKKPVRMINNNNDIHESNNSKIIHTHCQYINCNNNSNNRNIKFERLPKAPKLSELSSTNNKGLMNHFITYDFHNECYKRCGLLCNDERKNLRICTDHKIIKIEKDVPWLDTKEKQRISKKVTMYVPEEVS